MHQKAAHTPLSADDLISNEPLSAVSGSQIPDDDDRFRHRLVAERVAQLIAAPGSHVNVAVNGPWGSGKSSFFALLKEELKKVSESGDDTYVPVDFDAWQMADSTFEANFLATVADRVAENSPEAHARSEKKEKKDQKARAAAEKRKKKGKAPKAASTTTTKFRSNRSDIEDQLFRANRTVTLPFGFDISTSTRGKWILGIVLGLILGVSLWVAGFQTFQDRAVIDGLDAKDLAPIFPTFIGKLLGVLGATASGTLLAVIITALLSLRKVTVNESAPAHVAQFRRLFTSIFTDEAKTYVILVDELDRCAPDAVMRTLEGLRRFLGHQRCVFVVAFDRESVVETIDSELTRKVPARHGRPYYSTAGEYLDKIFTYQVALPPQSRRAFRAYARALVETKGDRGVWGELRRTDAEVLNRVTSILSPPHLTSPRRTKVILNDFAINARLTESFLGAWVDRAEEIAILTVLQTEFPLFYSDLEHYPSLLTHVAGSAEGSAGEALQPLVERYRSPEATLDTVLSKAPEQGDMMDEVVDPGRALAAQLKRFLRKLVDVQVQLPQADLIQLGTNQSILKFEDPSVYAVVEAAAEVPREESLPKLLTATGHDRHRAIELMLQRIDEEASAEANTLRILVGTILPSLEENARSELFFHVDSAWQRIIADDDVNKLSEEAFKGFTEMLLPTKNSTWVKTLLRATDEHLVLHVPSLDAVTEYGNARAVIDSRSEILNGAIAMLPHHDPLVNILRRLDVERDTPAMEAASARRVAEYLQSDGEGNDEETREEIAEAVHALVTLVAELNTHSPSPVRNWVMTVLRIRANAEESAVPAYLEAVDTLLADPRARLAGTHEILTALVREISTEVKASLASRLSADVKPAPTLVAPALIALLKMIADADEEGHAQTLVGIKALAESGNKTIEVDPAKVREVIGDAYASTASYSRARFEILRDVALALGHIPTLTELAHEFLATLTANAVRDVPDSSDRVHAVQGIRRLPSSSLHMVLDDLHERLPGTNGRRKWMVHVVLAAHHQLLRKNERIEPLSSDELSPYLAATGDTVARDSWIGTGPSAKRVLEVLDGASLSTVPSDTWKTYAGRAGYLMATVLWSRGVAGGASEKTLRALAAYGVDEPVRFQASKDLTRATNFTARRRALEVFDTLPHDAAAAAAISGPLEDWIHEARLSDARMVADMIFRHHSEFTVQVNARLRKSVPDWHFKMGKKLSAGATTQLRTLGYLPDTGKRRGGKP